MLDELRQRISQTLVAHQVCVIGACGWNDRPWMLPAAYRSRGLEIECLLPRWAELIFHLDEDPEVLLVIRESQAETSRWLEYRGRADIQEVPDWTEWGLSLEERNQPQNRYAVLHITPERIDLIDESRGWGYRETLDF